MTDKNQNTVAPNTSFGEHRLMNIAGLEEVRMQDFILLEPDRVIVNPNAPVEKVIDDATNAADYLKAITHMTARYGEVSTGRHLYRSLKKNVGWTRNIGFVKRSDGYHEAHADGVKLVVSDTLVTDKAWDPDTRMSIHNAIDTMLQARVVIVLDGSRKGIAGLAENLKTLMAAPDVATVLRLLQEWTEAAKDRKVIHRNAKQAAGQKRLDLPEELLVTLDGQPVDLMGIEDSNLRLEAIEQTGEPTGSKFYWNAGPYAVSTVKDHLARGRQFRTVSK